MIYFLLPAYNEEKDIAILLKRIQDAMRSYGYPHYTVVVVNDGSRDQTLAIVQDCQQRMPVKLINHNTNQGLGQAMLTGLSFAAAQVEDDDVVVTMDADNTHDPCLAGAMIEKIRSGADVVIASRYEKGGEEIGLSLHRSILSRGASRLLKLFFPIDGAKDYTCGFRAYRGAALRGVSTVYGSELVEERGFTCMAEILIKLRSVQARVTEVPLVLRYDLKSGPSKMKVSQTILRYFMLIGRSLLRRPSTFTLHERPASPL